MSDASVDSAGERVPAVEPRSGSRLALWGRFLLGGTLIWFGASKLFWPAALADTLWSTGFFMKEVVPLVAYGLPTAEILLGLAMASAVTAVFALPVILAISTCFTLLHAYLLISGTLVPCGCVGVAPHHADFSTHVWLLCVSAGMLALSSLLVVAQLGRPAPAARGGARAKGQPEAKT